MIPFFKLFKEQTTHGQASRSMRSRARARSQSERTQKRIKCFESVICMLHALLYVIWLWYACYEWSEGPAIKIVVVMAFGALRAEGCCDCTHTFVFLVAVEICILCVCVYTETVNLYSYETILTNKKGTKCCCRRRGGDG